MAITSPITSSTTGSTSSSSNAAQQELNSNYTTFLQLLTTQLQNQDPLNPTDSSQFTNQLVLFSQVEQQINTNSTLNSILTNQATGMTQQALSYIGLDVAVNGNTISYGGSGSVEMGYTLASAVSSSNIGIFNSNGTEVYSTTGQTAAGSYQFSWNGEDNSGAAVPAGTYTVQVTGVNQAGAPVTATTVVPGQVTGVTTQNGATYLTVNGAQIPMSNVVSASEPSGSS